MPEKAGEDESGRVGSQRPRKGRTAVRLAKVAETPARKLKSPSVRSTQKRADEVRRRVLDAALECFGAFGFDGTSTRAVADRAGVSHTLVLYHFTSKEQLWVAMMEDALSGYVSTIANRLDTHDGLSAGAALKVFIERFVRLHSKYPELHRIMTMEGNRNTPRVQWLIDNYLRQHYNRIRDLIRQGQEEGSVRDCDAARLYYVILGAGGTPFNLSVEYKELTGRDVFSESEIFRNIAMLYDIVFV